MNDDDAELAALRRLAANERRLHPAAAWALRAEASWTPPRRGVTPPTRSP